MKYANTQAARFHLPSIELPILLIEVPFAPFSGHLLTEERHERLIGYQNYKEARCRAKFVAVTRAQPAAIPLLWKAGRSRSKKK